MACYLIADIAVHDPEAYKDYVRQVPGFIAKYGGRYLVRGGDIKSVEGGWLPQRLIVLEFPTRAQAEAFVEDPGYAKVAAIRHGAATTRLVLADGFDG